MIEMPVVRRRRYVAAMVSLVSLALLPATGGIGAAAPQAANCAAEAATLARDESELPRIEVTSPGDRPVRCITIETLMSFASRLKAHIAHCPNSSYAASGATWEKARVDYSKQFTQNRCRRTLPN
jgi:hypothetical protein